MEMIATSKTYIICRKNGWDSRKMVSVHVNSTMIDELTGVKALHKPLKKKN